MNDLSLARRRIPIVPGMLSKKYKSILSTFMSMQNGSYNFYVYILTNKNKTVLYTGVTNDVAARLYQHINNTNTHSFTFRYNVQYLPFFERFQFIQHAISREKEIKGWSRNKKIDLINSMNPEWKFLNDEVN